MGFSCMVVVLFSVVTLLLGGVTSAVVRRSPVWSVRAGVSGALIGGGCGLLAAVWALAGGVSTSVSMPWPIPGGALNLGLDPLSAFFLVPIFGLTAVCSVYGKAYLNHYPSRKRLEFVWFFYNLLAASMAFVVLARNAVLFLVAWETMALASFFLVMLENEKEHTRRAGWIYMVATHLGTAFLLALFVILGERADSFSFDVWIQAGAGMPAALSGVLFIFAVIGFGAKAGYIPLHVWLPEAHPAAPSHVSALMSGVMIKTGIYGILRIGVCLGPPSPWWGGGLLAVGLISGVLGVLFALAQHDIKRLLAYHSVENIGIITLGLALGYGGVAYGAPHIAVLGFAGALLHVLNHAIFKGLLFLGAGSIIHGTGTGDIDALGGLLKRMRVTGPTFLVGAAAICGLPPLNGFISEFLLYFGAFLGVAGASSPMVVIGLAVIAGLALIGGLAAACFAKAFGIVFLGEPRSDHAKHAHEASAGMCVPMLILAGACVLIGVLAPVMVLGLEPAVATLIGPSLIEQDWAGLHSAVTALSWIVAFTMALSLLTVLLWALRKQLLSKRAVSQSGTWDCGYAAPVASMQYTASSFAQPLTDLFRPFLRTQRHQPNLDKIFPAEISFSTETEDLFHHYFYAPLFIHTAGVLAYLRKAQHGRIQWYVLYIALTLIALFAFSIE